MNAAGDGWQRVHPASPFVRGWVALAAMFFFFGRDAFERLLQGGPVFDERFAGRAPWLVLGGGTVLLLTVIGFVLSWYFTRYQVADGYVRVNTGVLFKQQRQARLDRVQAIDVVQPLLARIFGLAELRFEVADAGAVRGAPGLPARGRGPPAARDHPGQRLRCRAGTPSSPPSAPRGPEPPGPAGRHPPRPRPAPADRAGPPAGSRPAVEAPERVALTVPPQRLAGSLLLSEQSVFIVLGAVGLGAALGRHGKPELLSST